ncbi:MAG: fimbrillin family protein [Bacteroidales bacterium]|nr:fimbrillin family protein [Bacteroidales bacterium]
MKKFFLIAAAAVVAFASCSKNETPLVQDQNKAIGFGTYTGRAVTKADPDFFIPKTQTWLQKQAFGVYAYNTENVAFAGSVEDAKKFMVNEKVTFSGESASDATNYEMYTYENKKYWPNDEANNLLTFWAYYPYGKLTGGYGDNTFTAGTDPTKMVDLLVSDVKEDMTYTKATKVGTVGVVPFTFHHALTRVQFLVKAQDEYEGATIVLNSLTVKGVYDNGTITPAFAQGKTTYSWATPVGGEPAVYEVCAGDANINTDGTYFPIIVGEATGQDAQAAADTIKHIYLMIPQNIADVTAEIEYTVKSDDTTVDPVVNKVTINLATTAVSEWVMNKNILYTFVVGLRPIEFTAVVSDWDDLTEVEFIIPPVTNTSDNDNPATGEGN